MTAMDPGTVHDRAPDRPIVIFGGTFDPPHRRHVELLRGVDALLRAKQSLVIPAWRNPQRSEPGASGQDRLAMAELAFAGLPDVVVSDMELTVGAPSYSIDTVRRIHAMQESGQVMRGPLRLLIGSDQALNFTSWKDWADLAALATPVVVLRPPHTREDWPKLVHERHGEQWAPRWIAWTLPIDPVDVSGTDIRAKIAKGESLGDRLPEAVARYVRSAGLYGVTPARS